MKNNTFVIFTLLFLLATSATISALYIIKRHDMVVFENELCRGNLQYDSVTNKRANSYDIQHSIYFSKHGSGYDSMKGTIIINDERYVINRVVNFEYQKMPNSRIKLVILSVNITPRDTLPPETFQQYFSFYDKGTVNYIRIDMLSLHRVSIGGSMGEIMVCTY